MTAPVVSVIMAAYNGAALIRETIASLKAQTMADFEVIIVDDCSTDNTRAVLQSIADARFQIIESSVNQGPVKTRNIAVGHARGRYIAALDQDDLCYPQRFARQVAYLESHPEIALVAGAATLLENGAIRPSALPAITTPHLVEWMLGLLNPIVWSTVMLRSNVAQNLRPFGRPELLYAEDFDLYHRMLRHGGIARIDDPVLHYRIHAGGASQCYTKTMLDSSTRVLAESHADIFGAEAPARATLLIQHVMVGQPITDRATLAAMGETLTMLQQHFIDRRRPGPDDLRLIRWETARLWAKLGRAGLRSGKLVLADVLAVRPNHLSLGYAGPNELLVSGLVGSVRALRGVRRPESSTQKDPTVQTRACGGGRSQSRTSH